MTYQLWDTTSRNLIDEFDVEQDALETARAYLTPDDDGATIDVALVVYDDADKPVRSIHGNDLAALILGEAAPEAKRPA